MIKVAGVWELGWTTPIMEYYLWHFPLRDYGVDEWIMSPVSGIGKRVTEVKDIQTAIATNHDLIPVFIDEKGEAELEDFSHPENVLYILGKAGYSPYKAIGGLSVRIDTPKKSGLLWPHQAICLVLQDRVKKWQSR